MECWDKDCWEKKREIRKVLRAWRKGKKYKLDYQRKKREYKEICEGKKTKENKR